MARRSKLRELEDAIKKYFEKNQALYLSEFEEILKQTNGENK